METLSLSLCVCIYIYIHIIITMLHHLRSQWIRVDLPFCHNDHGVVHWQTFKSHSLFWAHITLPCVWVGLDVNENFIPNCFQNIQIIYEVLEARKNI